MPTSEHICRMTGYGCDGFSVMDIVTLSIVISGFISGCSCTRRPEWDSGLRKAEPRQRVQSGGTQREGSSDASASGSGSGSVGGGGDGGSGGSGSGNGEGAGGAENKEGKSGVGSGGSGPGGDSSEGSANGGGKQGGPAAGKQPNGEGGLGSEAALPPAALPGRPRPKPLYDAKAAADVAERKLRQADSSRSSGDLSNAYTAALEAFEAVEPHAELDDACKQLLGQAKRMLADLAESQNHKTVPAAVPTYFE